MIGGTKWPSITSTWITRAPAAITSVDLRAEPREVGREDRRRDPLAREELAAASAAVSSVAASISRQIELQHRVAAVLALHVLGAAHPAIVWCSPQFGALGDELEAAQAVDADEAARELRGAQPGLAAARAVRAARSAPSRRLSVPCRFPNRCRFVPPCHEGIERYTASCGGWCPRRKSAALIGFFPGGWTDVQAEAAVGAAEHQLAALGRDRPRLPGPVAETARRRPHPESLAVVELEVGADVRGQSARTIRSSSTAGRAGSRRRSSGEIFSA